NSYKVKFESSYRKSNPVKQVSGKQMAYVSPSPVRFPVGTRVIAVFQDNDWSKECYYSGVIAEPPKSMNKYRYLVFFDDGYAQYVTHEKILLVCESSRNVWDDIHPDSREFIRKYLEQYPERPMVKLQQGQIVKTEWNGKWWIARVVEVDGSLVKMHFDADGRTEWIYRGSTRLGPLYAELAHAAARKEQGTFSRHRGLGVASLKKVMGNRLNMPYVEYTRGTDGEEMKREDSGEILVNCKNYCNSLIFEILDGHGQSSETVPSRAVAKKSTTRRPDSNVDRMQDQQQVYPGVVEKSPQQPQGRVEPKKFEPHQCGPNCLNGTWYDPWAMKGENPLVIPMLCAWERQLNRCRGKRMVMYKAPCGRRLRNMEELHRYLRLTKSNMAVDLFDFDFWVHSFAEFVLERGFSNIKDLSYGSEHVAVPCVNCVDHSMPDYVTYSTKREPTDGVDLNLDPEFLIGCECTDDCQDRDKCACWQLTIQGTAYGPGGVVDPTVGYFYRRLPEPVMTGIYECNSRCKCSRTCLNRVAQQPLQLKLQVFKTENRGWGIRCLNDIPQGGFICIYAGRLLTEQGANEEGKNYGDEYLAELDYIEVVEKLKEGYESDVVQDDSDSPSEEKRGNEARSKEEGETSQDARDSDEEFQPAPWEKDKGNPLPEQSSIRTRLRNRNSRHGSFDNKASSEDRDSRKKASQSLSSIDHMYSDDEDSQLLRLPSRFAVVSEPKESDKSKRPRNQSVREFFGNEEYCYIMDAKNNGNIGRYLNHSCSPNVFVQNVFVDTHDLRFPWVAFFALTYIHAGTELTWDYNYDVGSVPGKVLHCYCGSNDCRGRLL
ncbi:Histone-lysine N-methyltransferase eggless, partial [Zootermopsis nevadensis]